MKTQQELADEAVKQETLDVLGAEIARVKNELQGSPITCPDCKHEISRHGSEGCDVELGDTYVEGLYGAALMAQGPCGCSAVTVELEEVKQ